MRRRNPLRAVLLAAACATSVFGCAESEPRPQEGAELYSLYCASCHGVEGRGDGPVAVALSPPPADLTRIAEHQGGRFVESKVLSTIDGRYEIAAHGARDMPVWGSIFLEEHRDDPFPVHRGMDDARALVDYLETIQITEMRDAPPPSEAVEAR